MTFVLYLLVMAVTTYLIRMLPMVFFRKKITSRFLRSFFYYIPYAVLSAMTFPAIFYSTGDYLASVIGCAIALGLAFVNCPLIIVTIASSVAAYLINILI